MHVMLTEAQEAEAAAGQAELPAFCNITVLVTHATHPSSVAMPAVLHLSIMSPICCSYWALRTACMGDWTCSAGKARAMLAAGEDDSQPSLLQQADTVYGAPQCCSLPQRAFLPAQVCI